MNPSSARRWLIAAVFYANLLSLACQVLWARKLNTLFGSTAAVFGAVLAVFLLGLALGAVWGGRQVERSERPWRLLAGCLAAAAAWCLASIPLFDLARLAYLALAPAGLGPVASAVSKLPAVVLLILPPTLAIGAMLPIATALLSRTGSELGRSIGTIYGADTLGAAAGALLAGFVLAPGLGLKAGTAALGLVGLGLAWALHREGPRLAAVPAPAAARQQSKERKAAKGGREIKSRKESPPPTAPSEKPTLGPASATGLRWMLAAFALSGAGAMLLETGWNRFFYVLNGTSVYSLAVVLAGFLAGIGAGSLLAARRIGKLKDLAAAVAVLQVVIAFAGVAVLRARVPFEQAYLAIFRGAESFAAFQTGVAFLIFALVFVATLAMGANFPLVARLATRRAGEAGSSVGRAYAVNTAGAVAGALLSELVVLPRWGFGGLMTCAVLAYLGSAAVFATMASPARRPRWALAAAGVVAIALCPPILDYDPPRIAVYYHGLRDRTWENLAQENRELTPIYERQGFYGQVSVLEAGGGLFLKHNGKTDATTFPGDNFAQYMMTHLPMALHPAPRRVVNIGLGGGITLDAVTRYPSVEEIVQVEIDPLVAEAARLHFADFNHRALDDPRVRMVFDDGRNFIERSRERYDVIVSEPPNIWVAGVSGLFTREFYLATRDRLLPGGLLSQWLPLHELSRDDFRLAVRTISGVFPHVAVWSNLNDGILLASMEPLPLAGEGLEKRLVLPGVADDVAAAGMRFSAMPDFMRKPMFDGSYLATLIVGETRLNTDDLPVLEFNSARNLFVYNKTEWADHWLAGRPVRPPRPLPPPR